jgi:hypothetical protein
MINVDVNLALEFQKEIVTEFFLLSLMLSTPLYYSDLDFPLQWNGDKYLPRGVKYPAMNFASAMSVDRAAIQLDDVDKVIIASFLNQDVRNRPVIVRVGALNANYQVIATVEIFRGIFDSWDKTESQVSIVAVNEFVLWNKKTLRTASATCPWVFNSPAVRSAASGVGIECNYQGAQTWCDQSYDRCVTLGNDLNFGGDRFIPSLQGMTIWWGKTPT